MPQNTTTTDDFFELRSQAEQKMQQSKLPTINHSSSPEEMLRLIHELAVHQIELEMQQQELIQSREELEKSLERYTDLYDFAPLGYLTLAPDSEIVELNLTAATILDAARSRIRGKKLKNFIIHKDHRRFEALLERVFSQKAPNYCEVELYVCKKDTLRPKIVHIEAVVNDNGNECRAILSDISREKMIEQNMLVTNERQRLILNLTHSGSWEWDLQTNRTLWSNELWYLLGLKPHTHEATYELWKHSIFDEDKVRVEQTVLKAVEHGQEFTIDWRVQDSSGQQRWIMSKGTPFKGDDDQVNRYLGIVVDITELKKAQEIGQKEQAFSKNIIDSIPGTFYIVGTEGCFTAWNTFLRDEIIGKSEGEMPHLKLLSIIHPQDRELVEQKIHNVLAYGLEDNVEARVLLHDGPEFRWYLMTGRKIIMEGKQFLIGTGIDITERKKIEEIQLFLSSSLYLSQKEPFFYALARYIAECLDMDFVCIDTLDGDGLTARTLAVWSDGHFEDNVEYSLKDTPCGDVVGKDVCCFPARVCQLFPHDQVLQDLRAESYIGVTLWNYSGHPIGLIAVISQRPLLNRKFAETMLKMVSIRAAGELERMQSDRALRTSEQNYRELFDGVPVGLYQSTMDGTITAVNHRYMDISKAKISDQNSWLARDAQISFVHQEKRIQFWDTLLKQGYINNFEADFHLMDGSVATLSNTAKVAFNEHQEPLYITGSFVDISEQKQHEKNRNKLEEQLQQSQKMEMVGRLAGGIAHDFNNMLTVILGHSEMALELFDPSEDAYGDLEAIRQAATRSADLTRQLLAFARKQIVVPKILELNTAVEELLPMLRRLIGEHIMLVWIPDCKNSKVNIDPSQIDQILVNLCVNARDAITGNGRITLTTGRQTLPDSTADAETSETEPVEYVTLSICDDGSGIDPQDLEHIFEPFFTTKELGKGTGLGLSTVYGIVKQNNGSILCESKPGTGTTITMHLPLYKVESTVNQETRTEQVSLKGHETILIVEDEPSILKLSTLILERNGYTVLAAATPTHALMAAENYKGTIDLLLTDVIMPEMNGSELSIQLHTSRPELKTLFMSGFTADIIASNSVLDSGTNFIQKPFDTKSLSTRVYTILNADTMP